MEDTIKTNTTEYEISRDKSIKEIIDLKSSISGYKIIEEEANMLKFRVDALMKSLEREVFY